MVILSAFADEISPDLNEQLDVMEAEGIRHIELRSAWKTGVLRLSEEQLATIKKETDRRGFKIASIGSGLGKYDINAPFESELNDIEIAINTAKFFGADKIRVFSYWDKSEGGDVLAHRDTVMTRMKALAAAAQVGGVTLGHENEGHIYGEQPAQCRDILDTVNSPHLKAIFDPANFIQAGVMPYEEAWPMLKDDIVYFHIKDALRETRKVTPAGEGDGGLPQILKEKLVDEGWEGMLSLEPHLNIPGPDGEKSGPLSFKAAVDGLTKVLDDLGVKYE